MTFGWQGFCVDHPEDWAPASLSGSEREGYARISSPGRLSLQIRWNKGGPDGLEPALDAYLLRLQKEAKRRREPFKAVRHEDGDRVVYHWVGKGQGRGGIFHMDGCVYFLEITGARRDALLPHVKTSLASFRGPSGDSTLWSVLGLRLRLPSGFRLEKHVFQAGKTQLWFARGLDRLECIRWGFAEQLLDRYDLEQWARAALGMVSARSQVEGSRLRLESSGILGKKVALVRLQSEDNQIVTVKASFRNERSAPAWDWLEGANPA